ncbi:MAG TPA: C1 family peptidase [Pyrinomonadaceae bacterium]|jgi:C1A family cysteine protease
MADEKVDVQKIQAEVREQGASWQAGETPISQLPRDERVKRLGVEPPPDAPSIEEVEQKIRSGEAQAAAEAASEGGLGAPTTFDWRNVGGSNYVTPIKNQGGCGSCVAFGTCATVETTFRVQRGNPALAIDLSEAQLFYCIARSEGATCGTGWWPEKALDGFQNIGVADEACYPYTAGDQNCTGRCADWQNRVTKIAGHTVLTSNLAAIKTHISTKGPASACFIVYDDFFAYHSGVYKHVSGAQAGGHCVSLIGYDDNQKCWIAKNSWGTGWGESGFFRIAYGECGIDTWDVRGVNGIVESGWINNKKVVGLWATDQTRNAWAYIQDIGWRRVAPDNDNVFFDMLTLLCTAKSSNRPVNVLQDQGVLKQVYVL